MVSVVTVIPVVRAWFLDSMYVGSEEMWPCVVVRKLIINEGSCHGDSKPVIYGDERRQTVVIGEINY